MPEFPGMERMSSQLCRSCALLICATVGATVVRVVVGGAFAASSSRVVFNRRPPASLFALRRMLEITRPLALVWRVVTAPLRRLPDLYILGEVRCGTTTLAALLRTRLAMQGPWTIWDVPLANEKESFYFVGHYFRVVSPWLYRLCFPLHTTRWLSQNFFRRPPAVLYEGCASYFSAPWAPSLVRKVTPRPVLVVCLREPVSQHVSWWRLEQGAHEWAIHGLGLGDAFLSLPSRRAYPPADFAGAIRLSRSSEVAAMWEAAEVLPEAWGDAWLQRLPEWAAPFPNGQLSAFDRMGRYADNIERWMRHFGPECFVFVSLDELEKGNTDAILNQIAAKCIDILGYGPQLLTTPHSHRTATDQPERMNASAAVPPHLEPDEATLRGLGEYYRPHNERLFALIGRDLGWHDDIRYWWYRSAAS
jgi:hypothetical protein